MLVIELPNGMFKGKVGGGYGSNNQMKKISYLWPPPVALQLVIPVRLMPESAKVEIY